MILRTINNGEFVCLDTIENQDATSFFTMLDDSSVICYTKPPRQTDENYYCFQGVRINNNKLKLLPRSDARYGRGLINDGSYDGRLYLTISTMGGNSSHIMFDYRFCDFSDLKTAPIRGYQIPKLMYNMLIPDSIVKNCRNIFIDTLNNYLYKLDDKSITIFSYDTTISQSIEKNLPIRKDQLIVSPNPFNSTLVLTFDNPDRKATISIFTINGKIVAKFIDFRNNFLKLNTHRWPTNLYIVKIQTTQKIIKRSICLVK